MKTLILAMVMLFSPMAFSEDYTQPWEFCGGFIDASPDEHAFYSQYLSGFLEAMSGETDGKSQASFFAAVWDLCKVEPGIPVRSAARAVYMSGGY